MEFKINEIFYSLQGEGFQTGTPAIFVRFSGCNLQCAFCDTEFETGQMRSLDQIIEEVSIFPASLVVLTGGEPSLFVTEELVDRLHQVGKVVSIETNGTNLLPANLDWVTCSPKPGGVLAIHKANELKVVYTGQDLAPLANFEAEHRFLQPCSGSNTNQVIAYILDHPEWRLSLQTHKLLDIR